MRTLKSPTRRRPVWQWALLALLVLVVGGAATVAGLVRLRVVDPARLAFWRQPQKQYPDDWVAVPVAAQKVPAFSTITKEQLTNPRTGQLATMMLPPSMAKKVISDFSMVNRVIGHEHHAGYPFTEQELLPQGTHSGVAGGIPPGKRAYTLDASKLKGIHDLGEGDHLDLLASIPIDMPGTAVPAAVHGGTMVLASPDTSLLPKRSVVRPLVEDGVVVTPVHIRMAPMSASSLMGGAFDADRPAARGHDCRRTGRGCSFGGGAGPEVRDHVRRAERPGCAACGQRAGGAKKAGPTVVREARGRLSASGQGVRPGEGLAC